MANNLKLNTFLIGLYAFLLIVTASIYVGYKLDDNSETTVYGFFIEMGDNVT